MNKIKMIGIDHSKASVAYRELFSFTKASATAAMEELKETKGVNGCIILSTCNRMELWISAGEELDSSLYHLLCRLKGVDPALYEEYFIQREGMEAVWHLFEMSCGLKSKIIGEDQIITQVKDALNLAREAFCTDKVLEMLFRTAVTAAKRVKTDVKISNKDTSAIDGAVQALKRTGFLLEGKTCMVIGNGEMGRLTALALEKEKADVTVTVRQYRSGQVSIPVGCSRINYGERLEYMENCDLVVSATASPNFTLKTEDVAGAKRKDRLIMIDLAVPRDIEPGVGELPGITLYDIDSFELHEENEQLKAGVEQARQILEEYIQEFTTWYDCRDLIPVIQGICTNAAKDVGLRIHKEVSHLEIGTEEKEKLESTIDKAASKVVNKLMFDLRENLNMDTWRECVEAIAKIYP